MAILTLLQYKGDFTRDDVPCVTGAGGGGGGGLTIIVS